MFQNLFDTDITNVVVSEKSFFNIKGEGKSIVEVDANQWILPLQPPPFKNIDLNIKKLNPLQTAFNEFYIDGSAIISAPTSAGKTIISVCFFQKYKDKPRLYIVPTRALAREIAQSLKQYFDNVELRLLGFNDNQQIKKNSIVVSTIDSVVVAARNNVFWTKAQAVVIDEVHQITNNSVGFHIEEVLTFYKMAKIPILCLSATLPGIADLAKWIETKLLIKSQWRPVPLYRKVVSINLKKINDLLLSYLNNDEKTILFVDSKKRGWKLLEFLNRDGYQIINQTIPFNLYPFNKEKKVAFHCADIPINEAADIEEKYKRDSDFPLLISTHTLAYGVNLPADCVSILVNANHNSLFPSPLDILQMEGRAGRFGLKEEGRSNILVINKGIYTVPNQKVENLINDSMYSDLKTSILNIINTSNDPVITLDTISLLVLIAISYTPDSYQFLKNTYSGRFISKSQLEITTHYLKKNGFITEEKTLTGKGIFAVKTNTPPSKVLEFVKRVHYKGLNTVSIRPLIKASFKSCLAFMEDETSIKYINVITQKYNALLKDIPINEEYTHLLLFFIDGKFFFLDNIKNPPGEFSKLQFEAIPIARSLFDAHKLGIINTNNDEIYKTVIQICIGLPYGWHYLRYLPKIGYIRAHGIKQALESINIPPPTEDTVIHRYFQPILKTSEFRMALTDVFSKRHKERSEVKKQVDFILSELNKYTLEEKFKDFSPYFIYQIKNIKKYVENK